MRLQSLIGAQLMACSRSQRNCSWFVTAAAAAPLPLPLPLLPPPQADVQEFKQAMEFVVKKQLEAKESQQASLYLQARVLDLEEELERERVR
jgi:hypothetical protein